MATKESTVLSLTDWVVLGVLTEEPRHGFAVAKELARDAELGQLWTVRRPLVYRRSTISSRSASRSRGLSSLAIKDPTAR